MKLFAGQRNHGPLIVELSESDFEPTVRSGDVCAVMVYMPGCPHCERMEPVFKELQVEFSDKIRFARLNAPANVSMAVRLGVSGVPTFLFFKQGELVIEIEGELDKEELRAAMERCLGPEDSQ